MFAVIHT